MKPVSTGVLRSPWLHICVLVCPPRRSDCSKTCTWCFVLCKAQAAPSPAEPLPTMAIRLLAFAISVDRYVEQNAAVQDGDSHST